MRPKSEAELGRGLTMKLSGGDHTLLMVHDRMRKATENLLDYLEVQQFDTAEQEKLWEELREAKEELWRLIDRRPRPKPSVQPTTSADGTT
jgi:hypothetical protein